MPATRPLLTLVAAAFVTVASLAAAPALAQARASSPATAPASRPAGPASLSAASSPDAECAALRKQYLDSQACFQNYRAANGSVRPEAYKRCREVVDPSPRCGPNLPTR